MNREKFYLEIGNIDEDLIQEAHEAHGHKIHKINFVRFVSMAACLCLVCTAVFFLNKDVVYFNEVDAPIASKVVAPADENTTIVTMTYQELLDYYDLEQFPDMLSNLRRVEENHYFVYRDSECIIYDTNVLRYKSDDGAQTLSILIAKEASCYDIKMEDEKQSKIAGESLMLAKSEEFAQGSTQFIYWAEISNQGVCMRVVSNGVDESSFINIIRELIESQK